MAFVLEGDFVTVEACFEDVFCHNNVLILQNIKVAPKPLDRIF